MSAIFLVVFRESLEAAIVIGILFAYLRRAGLGRLSWAVWAGAGVGVVACLGVGAAFLAILGEFEGKAEQIFEGSSMLFGAALMTTLILWIDRGDIRASIERLGASASSRARASMAVGLLVFFSVLKEGVEAVIFLGSSLRGSGAAGIALGLGGFASAALVAFLVFAAGVKMKLRRFFDVTNVLLLLFAAGLVGRAAGEFGEAGLVPSLVDRLWDLNPRIAEDGLVGSFLKGLFGYSATPSLTMLLVYLVYVAGVGLTLLARRQSKRPLVS